MLYVFNWLSISGKQIVGSMITMNIWKDLKLESEDIDRRSSLFAHYDDYFDNDNFLSNIPKFST